MSRARGLESVKVAIKVKEKPYDVYYFTRQDGSVLELTYPTKPSNQGSLVGVSNSSLPIHQSSFCSVISLPNI